MERVIFFVLAILANIQAFSAWKVVIDPKTVATVIENTGAQKLIEDQHNQRLDSISKNQQDLEKFTLSMATIKQAYYYTMTNITGFGSESKYYQEIGLCSWDIIKMIPELMKTVDKAKFTNKVMCLKELTDIVDQTRQLVTDFVYIVNNGRVSNPLKDGSKLDDKNDGLNILDRYDRLTVANKIYTDLLEIRYKLQAMSYMAQYATMNDFFFAIDPESWANYFTAHNKVALLISSWNNLRQSDWGW